MRALVCGGRDYQDANYIYTVLDGIRPTFVIHGKATGADSIAEAWADERGVEVRGFEAAWGDLNTPPVVLRHRRDGTPYNAAAGGIRNQRMLDEGKPDLVVAFPGGTGTKDMVHRALKAGVKVINHTAPRRPRL